VRAVVSLGEGCTVPSGDEDANQIERFPFPCKLAAGVTSGVIRGGTLAQQMIGNRSRNRTTKEGRWIGEGPGAVSIAQAISH